MTLRAHLCAQSLRPRACFRRGYSLFRWFRTRDDSLLAKHAGADGQKGSTRAPPSCPGPCGARDASASADAPITRLFRRPEGYMSIGHTLGHARPGSPPLSLGHEETKNPQIASFERMDFFPKHWGGESKSPDEFRDKRLCRPWLKPSGAGRNWFPTRILLARLLTNDS